MYQFNPSTLSAAKSWNKFVFWAMARSFTSGTRERIWSRYNTIHYRDGIDDYPVEDCEMAIPYDDDNAQPVIDAFKMVKVYKIVGTVIYVVIGSN